METIQALEASIEETEAEYFDISSNEENFVKMSNLFADLESFERAIEEYSSKVDKMYIMNIFS